MYHFGKALPAETLLVHKRGFKTKEEAHEWNDQHEFFENFPLYTSEQIVAWEGDVIWVPLKEEVYVDQS